MDDRPDESPAVRGGFCLYRGVCLLMSYQAVLFFYRYDKNSRNLPGIIIWDMEYSYFN